MTIRSARQLGPAFVLSSACRDRDISNPVIVLADCPMHCSARLAVANTKRSRLEKLAVLSPRWNASAGDPLLAVSLDSSLPRWQVESCIKLAKRLARLVLIEARTHKLKRHAALIQRSWSYHMWVAEHEAYSGIERDHPGLQEVLEELKKIQFKPTKLAELAFWSKTAVLLDPNDLSSKVTVQHVSADPPILVIDNVISKEECAEVVDWQKVLRQRMPPPWLCFESYETAQESVGLTSKDVWATNPKGYACFNDVVSSPLVSKLGYVHNFEIVEGMGAEGLPFGQDAAEPLRKLEEFLEHVLGLPRVHRQVFSAATYPRNGTYGSHVDCDADGDTEAWLTTLFYLSDTEGGDTFFPLLNKRVSPRCGRVVIFPNVKPDGSCDMRTLHEAAVVRDGTKSIIQRWYSGSADPSLMMWEPPPSHLLGYRPFSQILACRDEIDSVRGGRLPTRCRERMPGASLQQVQPRVPGHRKG